METYYPLRVFVIFTRLALTFWLISHCRASDHPLSQLLLHYQTDILQRLKSLITKYTDSSINQTEVYNRNEVADTKALTAAHGHEADISCEAETENMDVTDADNSDVTEHNESESSQPKSSSDPSATVEKTEFSTVGGTGKQTKDIQKSLHEVTQEIHRFLHRLLLMFAVAYEQLDGTVAQDLCYDGIEETFFTPIWKDLIALFRSDITLDFGSQFTLDFRSEFSLCFKSEFILYFRSEFTLEFTSSELTLVFSSEVTLDFGLGFHNDNNK